MPARTIVRHTRTNLTLYLDRLELQLSLLLDCAQLGRFIFCPVRDD